MNKTEKAIDKRKELLKKCEETSAFMRQYIDLLCNFERIIESRIISGWTKKEIIGSALAVCESMTSNLIELKERILEDYRVEPDEEEEEGERGGNGGSV